MLGKSEWLLEEPGNSANARHEFSGWTLRLVWEVKDGEMREMSVVFRNNKGTWGHGHSEYR